MRTKNFFRVKVRLSKMLLFFKLSRTPIFHNNSQWLFLTFFLKFYIANCWYRKNIQAWKCNLWHVNVFYIPEHNGGPHGIEFWRSWNAKMKYINGYSSKSRWKKRVICLAIMFRFLEFWLLTCQKWLIFCIFCWWRQKIGHSLSKMFKCTGKISLSSFGKWYG